MKIEYVDPAELTSYGGNPRSMGREDIEKLKRNIQKFGIVDPLIVDEENVVLGGNQRLLVVQELEMKEVPVVRVIGLNKEEKAALVISLNKISGDWDELKLRELLIVINSNKPEIMEFTAFSTVEFNNLMTTMASEIPELEKWDGEKGELTGMRYDVTFYFETEEDATSVKKFFKAKGRELNSGKLLKMVQDE